MTSPDNSPISPTSTLGRDAFVGRYGGIYEHSPWIAEAVWDAGLTDACDTPSGLAAAMAAVLEAANDDAKLTLIRAHPDLAGKAALRGDLTEESTNEQAGAGLDLCSAEEFERFQRLNSTYTEKFGFPFIIAVKGLDRHMILDAFEQRIANDPKTEFVTALEQINKIARLRLEAT